jgi:hypothetical protein
MVYIFRVDQQLGGQSTRAAAKKDPAYRGADPHFGIFWFGYFAAIVGFIAWVI